MAPGIKVTKEDIINTACKIVEKRGIEDINARSIAKELNCSIQPIFHNFTTMDELKKELLDKIYSKFKEYMKEGKNSYKESGMSYIKFARDFPNFFKIIFMSESNLKEDNYIENSDEIIQIGMKKTGLDHEEQKRFHFKVWIFTHGIATLVATKTCSLTDEEISKLLTEAVNGMLEQHKNR